MRILLINKSPVVGKLVTLSAQKTGDELRVVDSMAAVPGEHFDLLLLDNEFYSDENIATLQKTIQFEQSILIADRGTQKPSIFTKLLEKPFLPTDLVETLLTLNSVDSSLEEEQLSMGEIDGPDAKLAMDDEEEFEDDLGLDDDLSLEEAPSLDDALENETDDLNIDDLDLDLDTDDNFGLDDSLEFDDVLETQESDLELEGFDDAPTSNTSVLDAHDISEVKGLLEEDDTAQAEFSLDEDDVEEALIEEASKEESLDDLLDEVNELSLEGLEEEEEPLLDGFDDFDDASHTLSIEDTLDAEDSLDEEPLMHAEDDLADDFMTHEEPSDEDHGIAAGGAYGSLAEEALSEAHEDESFDFDEEALDLDGGLEMPQEEAELEVRGGYAALTAEALSEANEDEELEFEVDDDAMALDEIEAMLDSEEDMLDMTQEDDGLADFDAPIRDTEEELDTLTEEGLSQALGETATPTPTLTPTQKPSSSSNTMDQAKVLQTLLASLESDKLREALKGMKISINISFDE